MSIEGIAFLTAVVAAMTIFAAFLAWASRQDRR